MGSIHHLYISPVHNYFGHFGREAGNEPMIEMEEIKCLAGRGIEGDRFFDYKPDYKGQITFFQWEVYQRLCLELDTHDKSPSVFRRNVITREIDLNALIGQKFSVQGVEFEGVEEAKPCVWMNQGFASGAETALKNFGGLRARILSNGRLHLGLWP